jgi:hypothetical protein
MKQFTLLLPFLFLVGCVQSLHPYYTDDQLTWDKNLCGHWSDADGKNVFDIPEDAAEPDKKTYHVAYTDEKGKTAHFIVHLAKVDKYLLADITPEEMSVADGGMYKVHFLPVHSFLLVELNAQTLKIRAMKYEWLKKQLEDHPDSIAFEKPDDRIVLTAPPEKVQAFVLKHVETPDAYGDWTEFKRTAKAATQPAQEQFVPVK